MITDTIRADCAQVATRLGRLLDPLAGATVLVTGAAGFLAGYFLDLLAAFNATRPDRRTRVVAVDNFRAGSRQRIAHLLGERWFAMLDADIARRFDIDPKPDWIIHLAGIGSPTHYRANPLEVVAANVQGTWNMLELARKGAQGMLAFSSSEVYGDPAVIPTPEDDHGNVSFTGPRACLDESKRLAETLCATYRRLHRVPVTVARPFNVYGPGQRLDDGRIIPDLMRAALAGGPLVLYSDGRTTRSFCYVADFVEACMMLMLMREADGDAFNVGAAEEVSIATLSLLTAEIAADPPLKVEFHHSPEAAYLVDSPQRRCPDLSKLARLTGFKARTTLRQGLARTLASYRQERLAAPMLRQAGE